MQFKGAVRLTIEVPPDNKRRPALIIMDGNNEVAVLGTNAMKDLQLKSLCRTASATDQSSSGRALVNGHSKRRDKPKQASNQEGLVTVAERMYLKGGETKTLKLSCEKMTENCVIWSQDKMLPDIVWSGQNNLEIPVTNGSEKPRFFRAGERIGAVEKAVFDELKPLKY
ncbi:unnamed protein product [Heligmosomoides polygyrus]|uniref:DUF4968 domain-containing protein n=1 Tax=Heligmosomoides polygyrus TaxID=6339 RepID=A0A183G9N9_HELPZ|nr:unnamed protein product [Heligmosomoides polygyrus]